VVVGGQGHKVHVFDDTTNTADDPAAVATAQVGIQLHVGRLLLRRRILEADHSQLLQNTQRVRERVRTDGTRWWERGRGAHAPVDLWNLLLSVDIFNVLRHKLPDISLEEYEVTTAWLYKLDIYCTFAPCTVTTKEAVVP